MQRAHSVRPRYELGINLNTLRAYLVWSCRELGINLCMLRAHSVRPRYELGINLSTLRAQ